VRVEEEYADTLQSIETAIVTVYENNPDLVDRDVIAAIETLQRAYDKEKRKRPGLTPAPSGWSGVVHERCRDICEWRLGRQSLDGGEDVAEDPLPENLTISELLRVLKRLHKSIRLWHKEGGRQGYLKYVHGFISGTDIQLPI
jgi:hypothetical protein